MKRKIRGAVYDTDTAKLIASWPSAETDEVDDCLYRTKSGKYFTCELDPWQDPEDPSERVAYPYVINPKSRREAIGLACEALGPEKARPFFEGEAEGEKTLSVRVPARVYNILRDVAAERGTSMGQLIEELVNEGEPFGDDAATFDAIAENMRKREEALKKAGELFEKEARS